MAKESQNKAAEPAVQRQPKPDEAISAEPEGLLAGVLPNSQMAGGEPVEAQVKMLRRAGPVQRQTMLTQIGRRQGNGHVQRLVGVLRQPEGGEPVVQAKEAGPAATIQRQDEQERPTFEFFNLSGVLEAKGNMDRRLNDMTDFAQMGVRAGDVARAKLLAFSEKYRLAYQDYAAAVRGARAEAQNQNLWLGIVIGTACSVAAAFVLPSTAAGWFALTAAEAATAVASGAAQATVGAGLATALQFSGGDLEPGGLSPEAQEIPVWRTVASLYRTAATQAQTIRSLHRIVAGAEFLVGEIRTQVAGGLPTMTEEQALDKVEALIAADQAMARSDDGALRDGLRGLRGFQSDLDALNPESVSQRRMEQDIWIMWMGTLSDASVLDLDAIEDRLHAIGVLGPNSRLGVDFGIYTSEDDENEARDAARGESRALRAAAQPPRAPSSL